MNILKSQIKPFLLIKSSVNEHLLSTSQKKDNSLGINSNLTDLLACATNLFCISVYNSDICHLIRKFVLE